MTENWGEFQGKWDLVRVGGEVALSEFELSSFLCTVFPDLPNGIDRDGKMRCPRFRING